MDESIEKLSHELATVSENKLRAYADGDRVLIMVENAPAELRKLADALEKIDIKEVKAMVAYQNPNARKGGKKPPKLLPEKTS
jgi:hypothetical protein